MAELTASLGQLDRTTEARAALNKMLEMQPDFSVKLIETLYPKAKRWRQHTIEGLRKAGLSEEDEAGNMPKEPGA